MNTTLTFPVSGRTIPTTGSVSYTSPIGGSGSMVYVNAGFSTNGGASVSVDGVQIAGVSPLPTNVSYTSSNINLLENVSAAGGLSTYGAEVSSGFPTDRSGRPFLLLAPGSLVTLSVTNGRGCITVLSL
jgi:hypothetical protein